MKKIKVKTEGLAGGIWFLSWLFTIGFLQLNFWRGLVAMAIWPYYIGAWLRVFLKI